MRTIRGIIFTFMGVGVLLSIMLTILFKLNLPIFLLVIMVIFVCIGAGFLISRYFSGRLDSLYDGVQIVKSGNLDYKVNTYSEDGIGKVSKELLTVKLRYKEPDGNKSKLLELVVKNNLSVKTSDNFRFSASVASFGMLLRGSEFMGTTAIESILELARNAKGIDERSEEHTSELQSH